jgi:hypothetical protein
MQQGLLDELDSYLPPQIEDEEDMPTDKQTLDLHTRVAKIEGSLTSLKGLVVLLFPILIGFGYYVGRLGERVSHLEGEKGDPLGATIRGIESPGSRQQLDANLALLTGQILVDQVEGRKPKSENLIKISSAVKVASDNSPDDPEVWRAAMQLVDYKFQTRPVPSLPLPNCFEMAMQQTDDLYRNRQGAFIGEAPHTPGGATGELFNVSNCEVDLDDDGNFNSTVLGKIIERDKNEDPTLREFALRISNARIKYSGGKLLPFSFIEWSNCTFEPKPMNGIPSKSVQSFTSQLLTANIAEGKIQFQSGI